MTIIRVHKFSLRGIEGRVHELDETASFFWGLDYLIAFCSKKYCIPVKTFFF